ncbi:nucleotide sugar dehydrogenase [Methanobacterium alkalithermotolerans]|uniref:UDP-N-acetyl-D-mannosamine dehydrogenase n=1 Tax=Methanobacterium alkalithermotolerans TaxID=2731220 RepID=A0A8T8KBZ4_9EURY|nr:nucleotide sugar dehydrogenase [Methanobacterium alkalithermotolerans]QUH22901.1 nucleotide sugar dehydrogenase [Methanobacterium alkalithermotolerans]
MTEEKIRIALFGLGHMGLPTAALFADNGYKVVGIDINSETVSMVNDGKSPIMEPGLDELVENVVKKGLLSADNGISTLVKDSNVMIVVVPTPVDENKCSDLSAVISACESIAKVLNKDDLVIIESTIPPHTCQNIIIPLLEKSGLKASKDFGVAYTPERALPQNTLYEMTHNARVIGGVDQKSAKKAAALYGKITKGEVITVENLVTAEMVKLMENTYRDTNIALANELALVCESLGIDAIHAINAANYHPRVNIHNPGPGVGGHCLSIDPYFIVEMAKEGRYPARLIETAREINEFMPHHVAGLVKESLEACGKRLIDSKVGLLGVAYKGNVADARETPAEPFIRDIIQKGAEVLVHDPFVEENTIKNMGGVSVAFEDALNCDCVVLMTDHDIYRQITPEMIKNSILICTRPILDPAEFKKNGVIFKGVGRP